MKSLIWFIAVFGMLLLKSEAAEMEHYLMDSFALGSDAVILCEEKKVDFVEIKYHDGATLHCEMDCRIVESFKGNLKAGDDVQVTYGAEFSRYWIVQGGYMDRSTNPPTLVKPSNLPARKAVLFLKKDKVVGYRVVTAKLIQGTKILQFRQISNPGPYELIEQKPEKVQLAEGERYDEAAFLKDVRLSIAASRELKAPVPVRR